MKGFTVLGDHGFMACELHGDAAPGELSGYVDVQAGTPALYAVIADPATDAVLDPARGQLTITDPDGTVHQTTANTATQLAHVIDGHLQALCVLAPKPGRWTIRGASTVAASWRAVLSTVAELAPLPSSLPALVPQFPGTTGGSAEDVQFELLRWGCWPLAVVVATAGATAGRALDLAGFITSSLGLDAQAAASAVVQIAAQTGRGALLTIAREGGLTPPGATQKTLVNGAADHGLDGWTVTENGGDGWVVQSGYAGAIGFEHDFGASYAWCRKRQTIDLVGGAGLTAAYLDGAPAIVVTDFVASFAPSGETDASQYELTVSLLGSGGAVIKELGTGPVSLAPDPGRGWIRVDLALEGYGPGVRTLTFAHGGRDAREWDRQFGVKMTGAQVSVRLAPPEDSAANLVKNSSGQGGMEGWTNTSTGGDPWSAVDGPGRACPASPGAHAFAVTGATATKEQTIDLVAAGMSTELLDSSPLLQGGQWVASSPDGACTYSYEAELLNGAGQTIARLQPHSRVVPAAPRRFEPVAQALSGYPSGVRSIRVRHGAQAAAGATALIAGTSLQVRVPGGTANTARGARTAGAIVVEQPDTDPYWWVCRMRLFERDGAAPFGGSGVLLKLDAADAVILTAAHNLTGQGWLWSQKVSAVPAGGAGGKYAWRDASGDALQLPIEFLLRNQADLAYDGLYDYAVIRIDGTGWPFGGFRYAIEDDAQLEGQAATITAFPLGSGFVAGTMYTEPVTLHAEDPTLAVVTSSFTGGASGGPVYVRGSKRVVGVFSHGGEWFGLGSAYMRRLDDAAAADVRRWAQRRSDDERVCAMQLVIHTGDVLAGGTSDPVGLKFDGHDIPLDALWMPMSGSPAEAKRAGHFDGYDLSGALRDAYPDGLHMRDLKGKRYELRPTADPSLLRGSGWYVESLTFYVNRRRYLLRVVDRWIFEASADGISGQLP